MIRVRTTSLWFAASVVLALTPSSAFAQSAPETPPSSEPAVTFSPRAYIQLDWRGYPDWTVSPGSGALDHDTLEIRRARVGFEGRVHRVSYEVTLDPQDTDGTLVKDAYAQLRLSRAFRIRAGQFKLPGGASYGTSARTLDFLERPAFADTIDSGRDIGAALSGRVRGALSYEAGLFAGDGNGRGSRAGLTSAGRIEWTIARDLRVGGSGSLGRTTADDTDAANSFTGRAPSGYRFFDRVYVQGRRARLGADAEWSHGPWRVTAEALRTTDQRLEQGLDYEDLPDVVGTGWSTGVTRAFGRRRGTSRTRWREVDLGLRLDRLAFDDAGAATTLESVRPRATDLRPRAATTLTAGATWKPSRWARILANAAVEDYRDPRSAPDAGRTGRYYTFGMRLQIELP